MERLDEQFHRGRGRLPRDSIGGEGEGGNALEVRTGACEATKAGASAGRGGSMIERGRSHVLRQDKRVRAEIDGDSGGMGLGRESRRGAPHLPDDAEGSGMPLNGDLMDALREASGDISTASTLPPACYTGAEALAAETAGLLRRSWLGIARADEWRDAGDYSTFELAGTPTIVLRDEQGRLRAFANTCRHRGTRLLDGSGNATRIRCPFHGWTYGLDGNLRGATRMGETRGFRRADMGLVEFRTAERGGFVFVALSDGTPGIDEWLGAFDALHSPWRLDRLVTTRRRELEVDCNWKLFLEVFNESYHLEYVHASTFGGIYLEPELPDEVGGCVQSSFSPTEGTGGLKTDEQGHVLPTMPGLGARESAGTRYTWIFPALTFAAGSEALWVYGARPLGPGRCRVTQWVCFPPQTVASPRFEAEAERYYTRMDEALAEDIAVLERQQLGMDSPFARAGRWSDLEHGAAAFAAWYAKSLVQV